MVAIIFIMITITICIYMIFVGANKLKTEEERKLEDEEQIKYIRKYQNERNKNGGKKSRKIIQ